MNQRNGQNGDQQGVEGMAMWEDRLHAGSVPVLIAPGSVFPFPPSDGKKWYVMQTKPHNESRVITHIKLRTQEVDVFLPKIEVVRKRRGRRIRSLEPLFPSYLFVYMHLNPATWQAVRWAPGVRRILGDGESPLEVPEGLIQTIWERVAPLGFVRVGLNLTPGMRVRVKNGPFAGFEGIFERPTSRKERVRVLLEFLGSLRPVEIDPLDLEQV
ncbi:MAG: transcription termination/antitermination NusG family protein [Armatimonadota bacterium]|nr:transcription termination/antitermination NusG family protein [Armatimonadota bacterium]